MKRAKNLDIVRGIAVFWMVFSQALDFGSKDFLMYERWHDIGYDYFNWLPMFMFVSGVSVWLMVTNRQSIGQSKLRIFIHGAKRYGLYLFVSFVLSMVCFNGLATFLKLNEIVGAIAVYAFISMVLLLGLPRLEPYIIIVAFLIPILTSQQVKETFAGWFYPFYFVLPMFLFGVYSAKSIAKKDFKKMLLLGVTLFAISVLTKFFGDGISYVGKTVGFASLGSSTTIFLLILASKYESSRLLRPFEFFGKGALFFYVFHFVVWFNLMRVIGYQSLNPIDSAIYIGSAIALMITLRLRMIDIFKHARAFWQRHINLNGKR